MYIYIYIYVCIFAHGLADLRTTSAQVDCNPCYASLAASISATNVENQKSTLVFERAQGSP